METFTVIPAIDVLEGRCVRLSEGRREHVTIEGGDPAEAAARFVAEGATWLHVVDLDGAFSGRPTPGLVEQDRLGGRAGADRRRAARSGGGRGCNLRRRGSGDGRNRRPRRMSRNSPSGSASSSSSRSMRATASWSRTAGCSETDVTAGRLARTVRRRWRRPAPGHEHSPRRLARGPGPAAARGGARGRTARPRRRRHRLARRSVALRDLGCEGAVVGSALWSGRFGLAEALDTPRLTPAVDSNHPNP